MLLLPLLLLPHAHGLPRGLDRYRLHRLQHLFGDNIIDAPPAQAETAAMAGLQVRQIAPVGRACRVCAGTAAAADIGGLETGDCQDFRVRAAIMDPKEVPDGTTQSSPYS